MPPKKFITSSPGDTPVPDQGVTGPRSLTRLILLFDVLSLKPDGMSLAELNTALDTPKSSLLNLLRPLVSEGYLVHGDGIYQLGPSMFGLAASVMSAWNFPRIIRPYMDELVERTGVSALLGVLNREAEVMTYVEIIDSLHPVRYQIPVGTIRPLYASSAGRLLLAHTDETWREQYIQSTTFKFKMVTPMTRSSLRRELTKIKAEGVSVSFNNYLEGLAGIAAPVFDGEGKCIAALSIAGPSDRFFDNMDSLMATVKEVAERASGIFSSVKFKQSAGKAITKDLSNPNQLPVHPL